MPIIGPFLVSSIAGLSTVLGSFVIFFHWKKDNINKFITFCLSLSFSVMIGLSITELIPESTFIIITNYKIAKGIFLCFLIFFLGVGLIHYLNDKIVSKNSSQNLYKLGILSMLALMLHNLPEGIATFMSAYQDMDLGIKLAIAITLHNIPEGISIAVPLGALLAYLFFARFITATFISFILLLVAGIMITLSIQKLFPEALEYHENKYIWIGIIVGVILILVNHFVL